VSPVVVRAQETGEAESHYQQGMGFYDSGRYREALDEFQRSYSLQQLPKVLIAIGQAHKKLGRAEEALQFYQAYFQAVPDPSPELKAQVEGYIAEVRALLEARRLMEQKPRPRASGPAPRPRPQGLRAAKWVLGGIGLAGIAIGGVLWGLDGQKSCPQWPSCPQEFDGKTIGVGLFSAGLGLLGASAVMFGIDYRESRGERPALLSLGGRF
jgi:tetratricopeptide (TPR) repeat protein